jgi:hypothetical protein
MHIVPNLDSLKSSIVICDGIEHFSDRVLDASEPMRLLAIGPREGVGKHPPLAIGSAFSAKQAFADPRNTYASSRTLFSGCVGLTRHVRS